MDPQSEIRAFLTSRRARISPAEVGLAGGRNRRRVPGLRRAEVAVLAGVSVDYYNRLERGQVRGVSEHVLEALSNALRLGDVERAHLHALVQATRTAADGRLQPAGDELRPNVRLILDAISVPALLHNRRLDILASNRLGQALHSCLLDGVTHPPNHARFLFLDARAPDFYPGWEVIAEGTVPILRAEQARHPNDQVLSDLIAELTAHSAEFRAFWAAHDVRFFDTPSPVAYRHPVAGSFTLTFEALQLVREPGLTVAMYTTPPGSAGERALERLAHAAAESAASGNSDHTRPRPATTAHTSSGRAIS